MRRVRILRIVTRRNTGGPASHLTTLNIQCQDCYQNPQRDAGNIPTEFDVARMKAGLEQAGCSFTIFGGELLLVPERVLEELWAFGLEHFGSKRHPDQRLTHQRPPHQAVQAVQGEGRDFRRRFR